MYAHPCQISHLPDRPWRNETASQQTVWEKLGDATGIDTIGLPALQRANRGGIHQRQLELAFAGFQHVPDRYPADASRFHRNLPDIALFQPLAKPFQILREGPEDGFFHLKVTTGDTAANANADGLLVYIHARAAAV